MDFVQDLSRRTPVAQISITVWDGDNEDESSQRMFLWAAQSAARIQARTAASVRENLGTAYDVEVSFRRGSLTVLATIWGIAEIAIHYDEIRSAASRIAQDLRAFIDGLVDGPSRQYSASPYTLWVAEPATLVAGPRRARFLASRTRSANATPLLAALNQLVLVALLVHGW